jgi:hypothetical protein
MEPILKQSNEKDLPLLSICLSALYFSIQSSFANAGFGTFSLDLGTHIVSFAYRALAVY